jgi:hypothetical protein
MSVGVQQLRVWQHNVKACPLQHSNCCANCCGFCFHWSLSVPEIVCCRMTQLITFQ